MKKELIICLGLMIIILVTCSCSHSNYDYYRTNKIKPDIENLNPSYTQSDIDSYKKKYLNASDEFIIYCIKQDRYISE